MTILKKYLYATSLIFINHVVYSANINQNIPMSFTDYTLKENLLDDEVYMIELLIESVRSNYEDDYYSGDWLERDEARKEPDYKPSFPKEHVSRADTELKDKTWFSCQMLGETRPVRDITALRYLPLLDGLVLTGNQVKDISPLASSSRLKALYLHGNDIRSIEPLVNCKRLKYLNLTDNPITDLSPLESMESLETIELSANQISAFRKLTRLPNIRKLEFDLETFDSFEGFPEMPNLQIIRGAHVNSLAGLEKFASLENIDNLSGSIDSLKPMEDLKKLTHFNFYGTSISDLTPLAELDQLRSISLKTDRHIELAPLRSLPMLRDVSIIVKEAEHPDLGHLRENLQSWDIEFHSKAAKSKPSLSIEVVDQETFNFYDGYADYGIEVDQINHGLLSSELDWLDKKLESLLSKTLKNGDDYEIPFKWPGARSRTVVIYSQEAASALPKIITGIQEALSHAKNDWIIYFQSDYEFDTEKKDFIVWIYPDKIQTTSEYQPIVELLLNSK